MCIKPFVLFNVIISPSIPLSRRNPSGARKVLVHLDESALSLTVTADQH